MITEEQFLNKVDELMNTTKQTAMDKARRLYRSGAINSESYEDNYLLPKMFMIAMGDELKDMWAPHLLTKEQKADIKNFMEVL